MKFIDLFSGLGGFHVGLRNNGFKCVFSCEIDEKLRSLYLTNHGIEPHDDIRTIAEKDIPSHDILCAGFPCQPFSLAGKKKGADCPDSGKLIDHVIRIANYHQPKFILLENVPNILSIAKGSFWRYLTSAINSIGYKLDYKILSPIDLGIPQNRKRIFILAVRNDIDASTFSWPSPQAESQHAVTLQDILNEHFPHKKLEERKAALLVHWQKLLNDLKKIEGFRCVSIVAPEFGATYPYDFSGLSLKDMRGYRGAYGVSLSSCKTWAEIMLLLPSYIRDRKQVPDWIMRSVNWTRELYSHNKSICDEWSIDLDKSNNSWQILEWRGMPDLRDINLHMVQFRASGIRVFKQEVAPSLIAMTPTQIPIIPSQRRYISKYEAAKLQYLHTLKRLPEQNNQAFKALGNAVNARIIELIGRNLRDVVIA